MTSAGAQVGAVAAGDGGTAALINHAAADDCYIDGEVHQIGGLEREWVARQHDEIGKTVGLDGAGLEPGQARSVDREKREGLVNGERFGGCELDAVEGGARNRGRNRGERLGGCDRGVGGTDQMNTSGLETSRAIEMCNEAGLRGVLGTAEVDEAGVGDDPYAERHEPVYVVGRNQPAVFDAKPRDGAFAGETRSEERRVGKECRS